MPEPVKTTHEELPKDDAAFSLNRAVRMILSEGRKREELLNDLITFANEIRNAQDEDHDLVIDLQKKLAALEGLLDVEQGPTAPKAVKERTHIRYSKYLLALFTDDRIRTPYEFVEPIQAYVKEHGGFKVVVTPEHIRSSLNKLVTAGSLIHVGTNAYRLPAARDAS